MTIVRRQLAFVGDNCLGLLRPPAGTTTANTSPLKFTEGVKLGTLETGAIDFDGYNRIYAYVSGITIGTTVGSPSTTLSLYGSTTDNSTTTYLTFDGYYHFMLPAPTSTYSTVVNILTQIVGVSSDGYISSWNIKATASRQAATSTISIINQNTENITQQTDYPVDNVSLVADTTTAGVKIGVLGISGKTVKWSARMDATTIIYG